MSGRKDKPKHQPARAKTAPSKGKRYLCAICRKRSPIKVLKTPHYCSKCMNEILVE